MCFYSSFVSSWLGCNLLSFHILSSRIRRCGIENSAKPCIFELWPKCDIQHSSFNSYGVVFTWNYEWPVDCWWFGRTFNYKFSYSISALGSNLLNAYRIFFHKGHGKRAAVPTISSTKLPWQCVPWDSPEFGWYEGHVSVARGICSCHIYEYVINLVKECNYLQRKILFKTSGVEICHIGPFPFSLQSQCDFARFIQNLRFLITLMYDFLR